MTNQYPPNDPYGQYPTNDPYGQYPPNNPYGQPPLPPQKTGLSGLAITLIAFGALAAGCIGGVAVGGATSTTTASGSAETVTATVTETVMARARARATETVTAAPKAVTTAPEPEATKPKATEPTQAGTIQDGTWTVGEDIAAGTYKTVDAVGSTCYWSITRSGTNGSDIIQNDIVSGGYPRVTLKAGQDFESNRCGDWAKVG